MRVGVPITILVVLQQESSQDTRTASTPITCDISIAIELDLGQQLEDRVFTMAQHDIFGKMTRKNPYTHGMVWGWERGNDATRKRLAIRLAHLTRNSAYHRRCYDSLTFLVSESTGPFDVEQNDWLHGYL